ncbi:MAG: histidine kinase, partial [Chloroflexi bacterium]|nr:histidine kinase [Chloroflexota bacterium]
ATEVSLKLDFQDDELLIGIRDNGCGFDVSRALEGAVSVGHMGLLGIKQRVDALGGVLQITSDRGSGTKVEISMPIQPVSE